MKVIVEDYLQKIDYSLKEKTQKDIYMIYIMIFSLIFAFSYLLFWDTSEAAFKAKRAQVVALQSKIANDNNYLQLNPESKITYIENEIKKANEKMLSYKDNNQYIKNKIEDISSLIYDDQTWGQYLHSISANAKKNKIKILNLSNKYIKSTSSFGHILDINIRTSASFKNTINFINSLEQSELVVDLHDLSIEANKKLYSDINISVWGILY
ncbi:type 4a pilus biogenesis protein PilO [Sulfurimonas sp.]